MKEENHDPGLIHVARFHDRAEAGRLLGEALCALGLKDPVVLALPRGGVPVGLEVARALHAPLDLVLVRKIGAPGQPELAVAAVAEVAEAGQPAERAFDALTLGATGAGRDYVAGEEPAHLREIARRRALYLAGRRPEPLKGRTAVLVDDGMATGTTARAAVQAVRRAGPARVVLAVPVAPPEAVAQLRPEVDELICLRQPTFFHAVGVHYREFSQVSDDEVLALMRQARQRHQERHSDPKPK